MSLPTAILMELDRTVGAQMTENESFSISREDRERLSWKLAARITQVLADEVSIAITHPGGGLYDCLTLINDDAQSILMMNRNGESTLAGSKLFEKTWAKAQKDASATALKILQKTSLRTVDVVDSPNSIVSAMADLFAYHLEDPRARVEWLWRDDQDGAGDVNESRLLDLGIELPEHWKRMVSQVEFYGWRALVWAVFHADRLHSVVNASTGEVLYADATRQPTDVWDASADLYFERSGQPEERGDKELTLPLEVQEKLKFYVYALRDPRNNQVFYVGKGIRDRILQHKKEADENPESAKAKLARIQEIESAGHKVDHFFIRSEVETEDEAFAIEQAVIDAYDLAGLKLTNLVKGHHSSEVGLARIQDVVAKHAAPPMQHTPQPLVMLNLNALWNNKMSADDLYRESRRFWKVGEDARALARYAVIVAFGVVREVYRIESWEPTLVAEHAGKWEFNGEVAPEMAYLIGSHVRDSIKKGDASSYHKYLDGYTPPTAN